MHASRINIVDKQYNKPLKSAICGRAFGVGLILHACGLLHVDFISQDSPAVDPIVFTGLPAIRLIKG